MMDSLPSETHCHIASYLSLYDYVNFCSSHRSLGPLLGEESLWKNLAQRLFCYDLDLYDSQSGSWSKLFRSLYALSKKMERVDCHFWRKIFAVLEEAAQHPSAGFLCYLYEKIKRRCRSNPFEANPYPPEEYTWNRIAIRRFEVIEETERMKWRNNKEHKRALLEFCIQRVLGKEYDLVLSMLDLLGGKECALYQPIGAFEIIFTYHITNRGEPLFPEDAIFLAKYLLLPSYPKKKRERKGYALAVLPLNGIEMLDDAKRSLRRDHDGKARKFLEGTISFLMDIHTKKVKSAKKEKEEEHMGIPVSQLPLSLVMELDGECEREN